MGLNGKSEIIQLILPPMRNAIEPGVTEGGLESNPFDSIKLGQLLPRDQRVIKASGVRFHNPYQTRHTWTQGKVSAPVRADESATG
jgi:hypothetical protein